MEKIKSGSNRNGYLSRTKRGIGFITVISMIASHSVYGDEAGVMRGITAAHNKVRKEAGAPGLVWSDTVARFAQEWADHLAVHNGCAMQHRPRAGSGRQNYGENLYWASSIRWTDGTRRVQQITPVQVVRSWSSEAAYYNYATNSCQDGKVCGHYTQVVWAESKFLGCGQAVCADKNQIWVCNYDPPGNLAGHKPY